MDAIFYNPADNASTEKHKFLFKDIQIAFEHENDLKSGLITEVGHLLLLNSSLKVLVTYYDSNSNTDIRDLELKEMHNMISNSSSSELISANESFLVIFCDEETFTWEGNIYKNDRWIQLSKDDLVNPTLDRFKVKISKMNYTINEQLNGIDFLKDDAVALGRLESAAELRDIEKMLKKIEKAISKLPH